ncbi:MAG: hypothetical protein WCJ46_01270 [bacterium]
MKVENHAMVGVPVAVGIFYVSHSWLFFWVAILVGIFIDGDHVFDYIREEKKFNFRHLFIKSYKGDFKKIVLIGHAYEWIALAWIIGLFFKESSLPLVFTIAYLFHMIPDQIANNIKPWGYFITYRWLKKWKMSEIFYPPKPGRVKAVMEMEKKHAKAHKKS